jgi:hypothetical protein
MPETAYSAFSYLSTGAGTTARTSAARWGDVLNVKEFGAVGNGVADDATALQDALNAIQATETARALYIPAGTYNTSEVLYITNTSGVRVYGDGQLSSKIVYTGSASAGNTEATATAGALITPVLMINGCKYSSFENLWFSPKTGTNTVGVYIFQNAVKGITHSNNWQNCLVDGGVVSNSCATGWLIGYEANALCSEQTFINCGANNCASYGWRLQQANALNINLINCTGTFNAVFASAPIGSMNIYGASLAANTIDIQPGQTPMSIVGCRTESSNFVDMSTQSFASIVACTQIPGSVASSYFLNMANGSTATLDNCYYAIGASTDGPRIVSSANGGTIWIRGGYAEGGGNGTTPLLDDFQGFIKEYSPLTITPLTTVAALPTPASIWKGVKLYVTNSTVDLTGNFGATATASGAYTVPVFCDGAAWRIG